MNTSNSLSHLSLIHPDDTEHPNTPVSNIHFNDSIEFRDSDYISSDITELSDETKESQESTKFGNEDFDVYKVFECLPPIPPIKEEELIDNYYKEGFIDFDIEQKTYKGDIIYARELKEFKHKIGDGKMEYIKNPNTREMYTNAWKAITISNNWDFVSQDMESFMWSNDERINNISEKMEELGYNGHSGNSFGYTMRNMQFLVQKGEDEFKKLFENQEESEVNKFLDYIGGF